MDEHGNSTVYVQFGDADHHILGSTAVSLQQPPSTRINPITASPNLVLFQSPQQRWAIDRHHCQLVSMQHRAKDGVWLEQLADPYSDDYVGGLRLTLDADTSTTNLDIRQQCTVEQTVSSITAHFTELVDRLGAVHQIPTDITFEVTDSGLRVTPPPGYKY